MSIELSPGRRRLVLYACLAAMFASGIESTIVATAMPTIVADLGGFPLFGWVFAVYLLTQAVTIPIYGRLADLYGRKRVLCFGLSVFILGCLLCGFAPNMLMLILFRAIQGFGAGAVMPITLTVVGDAYPALERVRVQPYLASVFAGSSIVGPFLGAFIIEQTDWPVIFWFNVPIGLVAMGMLIVFLKEKPRTVEHTLDIAGALLLMLSITAVLLALHEANVFGWWSLALVAGSVLFFALFLRQERRSPEPLLPTALWRDRTLLVANLGSFAVGAAITSLTAYLPTFMQGVMGYSVFAAGMTLSIMSLSWPLGSTISSRIMLRKTYRYSARIGAIMMIASTLALAILAGAPLEIRISFLNGLWPAVTVFFIGAGFGFLNSTLHISMQEAAGGHTRGIATATVAFMRSAGGTFGTALLGAVLNVGLAAKLPNERDPIQELVNPEERLRLPPVDLARVIEGVGDVMGYVFLAAFVIATLGALTAFFVPALRPGTLASARKSGDTTP